MLSFSLCRMYRTIVRVARKRQQGTRSGTTSTATGPAESPGPGRSGVSSRRARSKLTPTCGRHRGPDGPRLADEGTDSLLGDMRNLAVARRGCSWRQTAAWRLAPTPARVVALLWAGWRLLATHAVPHRHRRVPDGRSGLAGRHVPIQTTVSCSTPCRGSICRSPTRRWPPPSSPPSPGCRWTGGERDDHGHHVRPPPGHDDDRAQPAAGCGSTPRSLAGRRGAGAAGSRPPSWRPPSIYLEPHAVELRLRPDQRRPHDPRHRRPACRAGRRGREACCSGIAIALKLTPAVFLLYLLLRRDTRALRVDRGLDDRRRRSSASSSPDGTRGSTGRRPSATPTASVPPRT